MRGIPTPKTITTGVLSALGLLSSIHAQAAPGQPTISWMESNFALVEIDLNGTVYNQTVKRKDFAEVPVSWNKWSGSDGHRVDYLLNGEVVLSQSLTPGSGGAQSGSATLQVSKGGQYDLQVAVCDDTACSTSDAKKIKVEDTDGSHMAPLDWTVNGSNKSYQNTSGKVVGSYFVEWGVYGRKYTVDMVPAHNLTHILYGFIPICGPNDSLLAGNAQGHQVLVKSCEGRPDYSVTIHDLWAAVQMGQKGAKDGSYRGNFGQLMALKQAYPDLKILPSVGGWTLSDPFYFLNNADNRKTFVDSVEEFLRTWKFFDGVDIDWEYPGGGGANPNLGDPVNGGNTYLKLMQELRVMLDKLSAETGRDYQLTSAVGAGRSKIERIDYGAVSQVIDNIFLMSYDYYGGWDNTKLGHMSGVYAPEFRPNDPLTRDFNAATGIDILQVQGADLSKVAVGVAMYGRGWTGVTYAQGASPMTGTATGPVAGSWEAGVVDYKDIVAFEKDSAWSKGYDTTAQAPYLYKAVTGDLISYDDANSVKAKGGLVKGRQLAGLFSWEIDADNGDILNAMHEALGHGDPLPNGKPVAKAGNDQMVVSGAATPVVLDGSGSTDPDADVLQYHWQQLSGPAVSLQNAASASASFAAPTVTVEQVLAFELTVSDGQLSDTDTVLVTVTTNDQPNSAPVITLPADLSVDAGSSVSLDALISDPDGDTLSVSWSVPAELNVTSQSDVRLVASTANVDVTTQVTVTAVVSDGELSATDEVVLTINPVVVGGCANTDPDAVNRPAWSANVTYNGGETVSYNNLVFKAKWWNQGQTPSTGDGPWQLLSNVELPWSAETVYNGGDEVNHNGRRYRAQYWTLNNEPGMSEVWLDIGAASCQ